MIRFLASILCLISMVSVAQGPVRYVETLSGLLQINPYSVATGPNSIYLVKKADDRDWGSPRAAVWTTLTNAIPNGTNVFASPYGGRWIFPDKNDPIQNSLWYSSGTNQWYIDHAGNLVLGGTTNVAEELSSLRGFAGNRVVRVATIQELRARVSLTTNEAALVLDAGSFSDNTGNATLFVSDPTSAASTNQTDTLERTGGGRWIVKRVSTEATPFLHTDERISSWFNSEAFTITSGGVSASGLLTNAALRWPDGSGGQYNVTTINSTFGAADAWTYTHLITGKTFTQSPVLRDSSGSVTNVPLISVSPPGDTFQYPFTNYIGGIGYYLTLDSFRLATNQFTVVIIGADTNGVTGTWVRSGSGTDDGANWWSDAAGVQIKRIQ